LESIAVYSKNITEKKGLEKSLIQSEKLATIGLLASGIAHELRNPLNIIETARYYIDEFLPEKNNDIAAKLEIISKNVKRASKIINSLLEYSRHSEYEHESIDLEKLVSNTLSLIEKEFVVKNIEYIFEGKPKTVAYFSLDSLKQVLLNVIINAVQAMPNGGQLAISVNKNSADSVDIKISDTGIGIPEENLPQLFSPFFTTKEVGVGTGLGLYVSHMIIEREGGKIRVDSKLDEGTTFTISLPASEESESVAAA
jgi:polar amino acid transport system substrate-binding protein